MKPNSIISQRLNNQGLSVQRFTKPQEAVSWLGAVQAQDFAAAKWALGLRIPGSSDSELERAFNQGHILRTHVLRPTWHFLAPQDIRWMLALTAPRVHAVSDNLYRREGIDQALMEKAEAVIHRVLQGGQAMTRDRLGSELTAAGLIDDQAQRLRLITMMMWAELDGLICSGPYIDKQFTYMLLEERVPHAPVLPHEEAIIELTRRYFASHGPASLKDFITWSGLLTGDAQYGLEQNKDVLTASEVDGTEFWYMASKPAGKPAAAYLLPNFDEYTVGYRDRSAFLADEDQQQTARGLSNVVLLEGKIAGLWRRKVSKHGMTITLQPLRPWSKSQYQAVEQAVRAYGRFLGLPLDIQMM
jgi:hypothetical protein